MSINYYFIHSEIIWVLGIQSTTKIVGMLVMFLRESEQHIIIQKLTAENAKSAEKAQRAKRESDSLRGKLKMENSS